MLPKHCEARMIDKPKITKNFWSQSAIRPRLAWNLLSTLSNVVTCKARVL
jgi:hypothetical protein